MSRLVDYFVVCGMKENQLEIDSSAGYVGNQPPLYRPYATQVLSHYPSNRSWNHFDENAIKIQSMPEGCKFVKNPSTLFSSFHTIIITRENGTHIYGSVLTFLQPIRDSSVIDSFLLLQNEYQSRNRIDLSPSHQYWYFNKTKDSLYATKCICFITSIPIFSLCQSYLKQLYAITVGNDKSILPIESYLYNMLYETHLPSPGQTILIQGPLEEIYWHLPGKGELPLCDYSLKKLFESLSLKNILKLLTCVLLEQQILMTSSDLQQLMLCAQCITSLLFPFCWPHVFVPILPLSQHGFLDAPVPFIMGLRMDNSDTNNANDLDIINKVSLTTIDIDNDVLETPEDLPLLPDYDKLHSKLIDILVQHKVDCTTHNEHDGIMDSTKPSIVDALKLVRTLSESGLAQHRVNPGGVAISAKTAENPIVKELHNIILRSGRGKDKPDTPTSVSPTTGALDTMGDETIDTDKKFLKLANEHLDFSNVARKAICDYFVEHFINYEHFIIMPDQDYQQWIRNREQFHNFDKAAFLSDQPVNCRPFYSAFLETAMFMSFVDSKLIVMWGEEVMGGANVTLFDKFIEDHRSNIGLLTTPSAGTTPTTACNYDNNGSIEEMQRPHPLGDGGSGDHASHDEGVFPLIESSLLAQGEEGEEPVTGTEAPLHNDLPKPINKEIKMNVKGTTAYHSKFVMQLWRESRLRVKHMLGNSPEAQHNVEENTHITNLCDLLERIWGHGLKKRESKSSLWAHLIAFGEKICHHHVNERSSPSNEISRSMTPEPYAYSSVKIPEHNRILMAHASLNESTPPPKRSTPSLFRRRFQSPELKSLVEAILQPPPSPFIDDLQIVNNMREIKTDVGHARAWIRLCLEKKNLYRHLSCLLSNVELCRHRYRDYAFLLTEDEKEQFLFHLLSLSAGDFNCFTTAFTETNMTYRVLVVGEGKYFGLSSSCLYVNVGGDYGQSGSVAIPRGNYQVEFTCRNLGTLTCVRLSHDNSGLIRSLLVEMVLVYCITTGQTYRFHCGRYFARAEDDGGIDRFIVGEKVSRKLKGSINIIALGVDDLLPSSGAVKWNRSPKKDIQEKPVLLTDIKGSVSSSIVKLLSVHQESTNDTLRIKLLDVLYGPNGLVKSLESALYLGYKSMRKFQKPLYLWDHIERVFLSRVVNDSSGGSNSTATGTIGNNSTATSTLLHEDDVDQSVLDAVSSISKLKNNGKDEKMMIFILLGLRDHTLTNWIKLLATSPLTQQAYEPISFMRDPELLSFLIDCLSSTHSLTIILEPLLIQGL